MSLNNFCNRCGSDQIHSKVQMLKCDNCELEIYLNPKPTTSIIFYLGNRVLIAKRARNPYQGKWGLPGGFIENGENLEECTQREVLEELGIKSTNPNYFCSIYCPEYEYQKENYTGICSIFYEEITLEKFNKIKPADDVAEVKLITRDQIQNLDFCYEIDILINCFFDKILEI